MLGRVGLGNEVILGAVDGYRRFIIFEPFRGF